MTNFDLVLGIEDGDKFAAARPPIGDTLHDKITQTGQAFATTFSSKRTEIYFRESCANLSDDELRELAAGWLRAEGHTVNIIYKVVAFDDEDTIVDPFSRLNG